MENALQEKNGISDKIEEINRTKRFIKNLFVDRECITLVKPIEDDELLSKLSDIDNSELSPEFVK